MQRVNGGAAAALLSKAAGGRKGARAAQAAAKVSAHSLQRAVVTDVAPLGTYLRPALRCQLHGCCGRCAWTIVAGVRVSDAVFASLPGEEAGKEGGGRCDG